MILLELIDEACKRYDSIAVEEERIRDGRRKRASEIEEGARPAGMGSAYPI
jgi:hypothetical protein